MSFIPDRGRFLDDDLRGIVRDPEREGWLNGYADAIEVVLEARGIDVPPEVHRVIATCGHPVVLGIYLRCAATAVTAAEVAAPVAVPDYWTCTVKEGLVAGPAQIY